MTISNTIICLVGVALMLFLEYFTISDDEFKKGFEKGYEHGKKIKKCNYDLDTKYILEKYKHIEATCREKSRSIKITDKEKDYLRYRADCYRDIIMDLEKGYKNGIS